VRRASGKLTGRESESETKRLFPRGVHARGFGGRGVEWEHDRPSLNSLSRGGGGLSPSARFLAARAHDGRRRPADAGGAMQALRCACAGANDGEKAKACAAGIEHEATSATSAAPTGMVGCGLLSRARGGSVRLAWQRCGFAWLPFRASPWLQVRG